ncbi:hypothetical protein F5Y16DRAFT_119252 [Xylariaceae sp. FL0255]|nr:hypothetical protein F5Y16DRAFT_119252 [Xylariaceae sp. FL0255]
MDVTSLLNAATAVQRHVPANGEEEMMHRNSVSSSEGSLMRYGSSTDTSPSEKSSSRRLSESKTPSRSRTPWSANGYALPLILDTKSTPAPARSSLFQSESPIEPISPKSPRHKCSDSHSSLSSYASSSSSITHSRLSSLSTVGGIQPLCTIPDVSSLEIGPESAETTKDGHQCTGRDVLSSPIPTIEEASVHEPERLGSPSDAMLISKPLDGFARFESHDTFGQDRDPFSLLAPPDLLRAHKRTVSAPNFAVTKSLDRNFVPYSTNYRLGALPYNENNSPSFVMDNPNNPALTGNPPPPTGNPSPATSSSVASSASADGSSAQQELNLLCLYMENCDTGSTLRKAISHFFGRNKLSTRMIPRNTWVHYCRKHYQRARYRNAHEWAKRQCELIIIQIKRVQEWSDMNQRSGRSGDVKDWSLSMRKRELDRVCDKQNKRPLDDSDDDEDRHDRAILTGTAVPQWLRDMCRGGYTSTEIIAIMQRLLEDIIRLQLTQVPDIEILPNILSDETPSKKTKVAKKTKSSAKIHKRSQSVGVTLNSQISPLGAHRHSQSSTWQMGGPSSLASIVSVDESQRAAVPSAYGVDFGSFPESATRSVTNLAIRSGHPQHDRSMSFSTYTGSRPFVFQGGNGVADSISASDFGSGYGTHSNAPTNFGNSESRSYNVPSTNASNWSTPIYSNQSSHVGSGHSRHQSSPINTHWTPRSGAEIPAYPPRSHSNYSTDPYAYHSSYSPWNHAPPPNTPHQPSGSRYLTIPSTAQVLPAFSGIQTSLAPLREPNNQGPDRPNSLYTERH